MISSLLDTDLYKLTMMQHVYHRYTSAEVEYTFHCRDQDVDFTKSLQTIEAAIAELCELRFKAQEISYLDELGFFSPDFLGFLQDFQLNPDYIDCRLLPSGRLSLRVKGPWLETILFEVPLLAIINESYFRECNLSLQETLSRGRQRLYQKIELIKKYGRDLKFTDFGTRRRFSSDWQVEVVKTLKSELEGCFYGTSCVSIAQSCGLMPVGTMGHELLQAGQVLAPDLEGSQKFVLANWQREFGESLAIALSDVLGVDAFLDDFSEELANLYKGVRHDSGDPYLFGDKVIFHYKKYGIDPFEKSLVFSDSLTVEKMISIHRYFKDRIQVRFGIGTHLTNDLGLEPLNIVLKMTRCNNQPVAKISDAVGKSVCQDIDFLSQLKQVKIMKSTHYLLH